MKTFILSKKTKAGGPTQPSAEILKAIEDSDKQPEECNKIFDFGICKIRHAKAVRDYKAAIATGAKRPKKEPCYYCQLITDKLLEEAAKAKGENAIEYEEEEPKKTSSKAVVKKVTKELDYESNAVVPAEKEKTPKLPQKVSELAEAKCAFCGKTFTPSNPINIYCSIACRDKQNNKKRVEKYQKLKKPPVSKKCLCCGEEFLSSIPNKLFCCNKCRYEYNNKMRSPTPNEFNKTEAVAEAVPEVKENQPPKEAPVNSYALKEDKAEKPSKPVYYTSDRHALTRLSDSLQRFNEVVDLILDKADGVVRHIAFYLAEDIYETNKRIESHIGRLEGTPS